MAHPACRIRRPQAVIDEPQAADPSAVTTNLIAADAVVPSVGVLCMGYAPPNGTDQVIPAADQPGRSGTAGSRPAPPAKGPADCSSNASYLPGRQRLVI